MARTTKPPKDRTGLVIAVVFHVILIGAIAFWAYKTGKFEQLRQAVLQYVRAEKKEQKRPEPIQQKAASAKLPPINQGLPLAAGSGTRRAVAAGAPSAPGESFFQDTRQQVQGSGSAGAATAASRPQPALPKATALPPPPIFKPPPPSTIKSLLQERAKALASIEAIGTEQIAKTGSSDAGGVVNRIAGASIVDGKFAVIRGLSDRYVTTTLNGARIPSADPYRQSASLDLFPAQVIDRVVVSKTFTPEQPGTFTGGGIDIVTKSFPEAPFFSLSLGGAYNTQASLNDHFLTYKGGALDWAAMDDGSRALPGELVGQTPPSAPATSGSVGSTIYFQTLSNAFLLDKLTRAMGATEFAPHHEAAPLNQNFSATGGGTTHIFDGPFGYFAGVSYKHDYASYEDGVSGRYQNGTEPRNHYQDARALSAANWSGMVNLAYRPFEDHELGFTFFFNQNAVDDARVQDHGFDSTDPASTFRKFNLYWTERNLNTYQMKGEHRFPVADAIQFNWLVALTQTTQDEPDARFFNDIDSGQGPTTGANSVPIPSNPTRYFRYLDENNQNVKLDWTVPFRNWTEKEGKLKFGLFDSYSERSFSDRAFEYRTGSAASGAYSGDPNFFVTPDNLGLDHIQTNRNSLTYAWDHYIQSFDSLYDAHLGVQAGYLMTELPLGESLRLIGGARYETTDLLVHSESYRDSTVTGLRTNDSQIVQADLLPSVGLIYSISKNMNLRLHYSQTIARPSFREMAAYFSYDPVVNDFVEGNPLLKMTSIDNYDVRWEWFPRPGELVSFGVFYKDLRNAIERGDLKQEGDVITFLNRDRATLYGIELEARKNLDFLDAALSPFSLGGNLSLVQSEVDLTREELFNKRQFLPNASSTRPLYDQSPYIVNLDLSYENPRAGTTASLVFNVAGPRIAITKINTEDVYEQPAPSLDFVLSQRLGRHMTIKFSAKNLLDPQIERTYGLNSNLLYDSYTRGRTFGLMLTYDY